MADLARRLGVPIYVAVGVMECLWHWTAKYAPAGDVGKWGAAGISKGVNWDGPADGLVAALVASKFLDEHPEHGFVIHDWAEHADDAVHLTMARSGKRFCDDSIPKMTRMNREERTACEAKYARNTHGTRTECTPTHAPPSPPLPSQAIPSPAPPTPPTDARTDRAAAAAGESGTVKLLPRQALLYHRLLTKPTWVPEGQGWIEATMARDLAKKPTTSEALIAYWLREAKNDRARIKSVAGFLISKLKDPDEELSAALAAQEAGT